MSRDISQGIDPSMAYLSSAFKTNSTDSTMSRMLGQDVKQKAQFCCECGKKCDVAYPPPNSPNATEVYCKEHYEQLFASKCEGCNKAIMGEYVNANGKKYHKTCYSQDIQCASCSKMVFGEILQACGKYWHPKCFKCTLCYTALGDNFKERNGFPYCEKCYSQPPAWNPGKSSLVKTETEERQVLEKNRTGQQVFQNVQKGKLFCAECGQIIGVGEAVTHRDSTFHPNCFRCAKCGNTLESGFKEVNGLPHCASCSGGGSGSGGKFCGGCGQKLAGPYVNAMGSAWHKECFTCTKCKKALTGGYAENNGEPYCGECIMKVTQPSTTTILGQKKQGFTIDPRTGEKKYRN